MKTNKHVIVGGGIAGLMAALLLSSQDGNQVFLVEQSHRLGGLLHTYCYPSGHRFDCGMHFWSETGHAELDAILFGLLPEQEWLHLTGSRRDCSGVFFRDKIQFHSQYPDLRDIPEEDYRVCLADFFFNLNGNDHDGDFVDTLASYMRQRFGSHIADSYINPIAEKVHGCRAELLHPMARFIPLLDRVVLFDERNIADLMGSNLLRSRIAYPEQRRLPLKHSSGLSSRYPRHYGIGQVIESLRERLLQNGVTIFLKSQVAEITTKGNAVQALTISHDDGSSLCLDALSTLFWTGSQYPLARLLGVQSGAGMPPPSRRTVLVNMMVKDISPLKDLYCLFCADSAFSTYRVTNYAAYCSDAAGVDGYPISMELIVDAARCHDQDALGRQAVDEARKMGLLSLDEMPRFIYVEVLAGGFPVLSRQNMAAQSEVRHAVSDLGLGNLVRGGILAEDDLFFQKDILLDVYRKTEAWR